MRSLKKFFLVIFAITFSAISNAAPLYYTFEGTVNRISDPFNDALSAGITTGDYIQHTFLVDFEQDGYLVLNDGSFEYENDDHSVYENTTFDMDIFYVDYVSGTQVITTSIDTTYSEHNKGQSIQYTDNITGVKTPGLNLLFGSNAVDVGTNNSLVSDWVIGEELLYYNRWSSSVLSKSYIEGTVYLTSISEVSPVPLPPSILLFLSGFIAILGFKRNKK